MGSTPALCQECPLEGRPRMPRSSLQDPDVLFVGGYPLDTDVKNGAFMGRNSSLLRRMIQMLQGQRGPGDQLYIDYAYACQCSPAYDNEKKKFLITAEDIKRCSRYLQERIDRTSPKVIVAMGADALRALSFKGNQRDMRGGIYHFMRNDGNKVPVIATYHVVEVAKSPGLVPTFQKDIEKAFVLARDGMADMDMDIRTPLDAVGIIEALDGILKMASERRRETGRPLGVSLDTETTSVSPYDQDARVIAVSMSWARNVGLAYPFEHKKVPFQADEFSAIRKKTEEVLASEDIALIYANGKFDIQWLKYHYGLDVGPLRYDTMLAEHVLDEDKKGEYSLKDITRDRFPSMGKYEEELKAHLQDVWAAKDAEVKRILDEHKEQDNEAVIAWWTSLDPGRRLSLLSVWVERGYLSLVDTSGLHNVSRRKYKGEMVIPKKYRNAVTKLISSVPKEEIPAEAHASEPVIPDDLRVHSFEDADVGILLKYAAIDALTTRMICEDQNKDFVRDIARVRSMEASQGRKIPALTCRQAMDRISLPLSECIAHMEYHGVRLDREKAKAYRDILVEKIAESKDIMFTEVGRKFNPSSSAPDLGKILFDEMKLPVLKSTDSGAPSTDAETIKELSDKYDLPFLSSLLVYRKLDKCLHTYIDNWLAMSQYDGRIHAKFNQIGTATYRLSSSNPNLQNVPFSLKEANLNLKSLFIPDSDDYELYDLDISNAEMRVLTGYSKDEALTGAFNHGKDLHCLTAAGISEYTYEDIKANKEDKTTDQYRKRQLAKKVNFGTIYCMSPDRLKQQLWSELRIDESLEQCQEYLDKFFETYPGVRQYIEETKRMIRRYGFTWTYTGRLRRFAIAAMSRSQMSRFERQGVNARIQTTSSDLVMSNLIDIQRWLLPLGGRVLLTVHDSIPFQLLKGCDGVKKELDRIIIERTAQRAPWLPVQWKYDVGKGPNYGDTHGEVL